MNYLFAGLTIGSISFLLGAGEPTRKFEHSPDELKLFELANQERKQHDLPPLKLNSALSKIARAHSENMARQGKMEHKLDDKNVFDRLRDSKFKFMKAGENLAFGEKGAALPAIVKAWMESKSHRANILLPEFSETGLGVALDKEGQLYLTQVFAKPRPAE